MALALSADEFIAEVTLRAGPIASSFSDGRVFITFSRGTDKTQVVIEGFDRRDRTKPAPGLIGAKRAGDVSVETAYGGERRIRKKTGTTQAIAQYVADEINAEKTVMEAERKGRAIKSDDGSVIAFAHPKPSSGYAAARCARRSP